MKLKKYRILLSGGIVISAVVPIAAVLSCDEPLATQTEVDAEQNRINGLETTTVLRSSIVDGVTTAVEITNANSLNVLKQTFGLDTTLNFGKFSYWYVNGELLRDGSLAFTITVKSRAQTPLVGNAPAQHIVTVTGITIALANTEQARVNGLVTTPAKNVGEKIAAVTTPLEIARESSAVILARFGLIATGFNFDKFSYWYTNGELAKTGNLNFTISVHDKIDGTIVAIDPNPTTKTVAITFITPQDGVNIEQARVNDLVTEPTERISGVAAVTTPLEITSESSANVLAGFGLTATGFDFETFSYWYTNDALITSGELNFIISVKYKTNATIVATSPQPATKRVVITIPTPLDLVNKEQDRINNLQSIGVIRTSTIVAVTTPTKISGNDVFANFGLHGIFDFNTFDYFYTNGALSGDGPLHFTISVGHKANPTIVATNPTPIEKIVAVSGIDESIATNAEQDRINKLATSPVVSTDTSIAAVTTSVEITSGNLASIITKFGLSPSTSFDFRKFSYWYTNDALNSDGDLNFMISVRGKTFNILPTNPVPIANKTQVTGIDAAVRAAQAAVTLEQKKINGFHEPVGHATTSTSIPLVTRAEITEANKDDILKQFGLTVSATIFHFDRFSYWYSNNELKADGDLEFKILVADKKTPSIVSLALIPKTYKVNITGIAAAASAALVLVEVEQDKINKIGDNGPLLFNLPIDQVWIVKKTDIAKLQNALRVIIDQFYTVDFNRFKYTYTISDVSLTNKTLNLTIFVSDKTTPTIVPVANPPIAIGMHTNA